MVENPGAEALDAAGQSRKEKRKALKKQKRKQGRRELAAREREEEEARANDPEEQLRIHLNEQEAAEAAERDRKAFEESERLWLEAAAARRAEEEQKEEEARRKSILEEESQKDEAKETNELGEGDDWEYVEEGPAEIIWKGNEIIVKKKRIRVPRRGADNRLVKEEDDRPTSNPLPPQSMAFDTFNSLPPVSAQEVLDSVAQQVPNFGTEQDKAHCPFHLKTGACRFGARCSRVHFYPDKSCTLLTKNMYNGPGIAWEQDEGLEYTDEEVERCYEEFYEDVHTEFLKFGELVNFKVCRNSSFHLRGNVYIHYKNLESAILAYNTMNGRYYAGKQITCEFVNIARWKIAICGEYMKSRLKTCSHGTACNFIHCFHNPGGDYEWADWDNPPPRYWVKKMDVLFGPCNELRHDMDEELENQQLPRKSNKKRMQKSDGNDCRGARYSETGLSSSSGGDDSDGGRDRYSSRPKRSYSRHRRKSIDFTDKWERSPRDHVPEVDCSDYSRYDVGDDMLKAKDSSSSHKEKKFRDRSCVEYHDIHARKHGKSDSHSRSREKIAADGEGKLEKKSKYHGQQKRRHELINSDGSYNKTKDGSQRDDLSSNRANYKLVSDDGEEYNDSPRSADLYSEKGLSYKRHVDSDRFDRCNEFKKSHERSSSTYQSHHRWCYNESKFRKQEANGEDLSPIESLDDWKIVDAKFGEVHNKSVRSSSHCRSDLADSKSLESSNASLYEHKHERSITRRKRHRKKGEHQDMEEENGDAAL